VAEFGIKAGFQEALETRAAILVNVFLGNDFEYCLPSASSFISKHIVISMAEGVPWRAYALIQCYTLEIKLNYVSRIQKVFAICYNDNEREFGGDVEDEILDSSHQRSRLTGVSRAKARITFEATRAIH
jgi:hypothetical protein